MISLFQIKAITLKLTFSFFPLKDSSRMNETPRPSVAFHDQGTPKEMPALGIETSEKRWNNILYGEVKARGGKKKQNSLDTKVENQ
jgi:hypothetical protein